MVPSVSATVLDGRTDVIGAADVFASDLDGDGFQDLIVAYVETNGLVVFWGTGSGFDVDGSTRVDTLLGADQPIRAAAVNADDDAAPELAVIADDEMFIVNFAADRIPTVGDPVLILNTFVNGPMFSDVRIRAGDLDGDGVDDLVIADRFGLTVVRSIAHTDAEGAP